jgi:hypothetical protein
MLHMLLKQEAEAEGGHEDMNWSRRSPARPSHLHSCRDDQGCT